MIEVPHLSETGNLHPNIMKNCTSYLQIIMEIIAISIIIINGKGSKKAYSEINFDPHNTKIKAINDNFLLCCKMLFTCCDDTHGK